MERVTIHEIKEVHLTINEPFCVIQRFGDGTFVMFKSVNEERVMKVSNLNDLLCRISRLDANDARHINSMKQATQAEIEEAQKIIAIFNNNL
jgi:hypothetical protein